MFRHGEISTEVDKKQFVFTVVCFVVSVAVGLIIFISFKGSYLAVFAAVMMLVLAAAAFFVLFGLLSDYAYIEDGMLHMHYLLKDSQIRIKDIRKITLKKDVYHVYDRKNKETGTFNALAIGIDRILHELYRNNVTFE